MVSLSKRMWFCMYVFSGATGATGARHSVGVSGVVVAPDSCSSSCLQRLFSSDTSCSSARVYSGVPADLTQATCSHRVDVLQPVKRRVVPG